MFTPFPQSWTSFDATVFSGRTRELCQREINMNVQHSFFLNHIITHMYIQGHRNEFKSGGQTYKNSEKCLIPIFYICYITNSGKRGLPPPPVSTTLTYNGPVQFCKKSYICFTKGSLCINYVLRRSQICSTKYICGTHLA